LLRAADSPEAVARKAELDPDDPDSALTLNDAGDQLWAAGQVADAEDSYRRARTRLAAITARGGHDAACARELARSCFHLFLLLAGQDQPRDRDELRREGIAAFQALSTGEKAALVGHLKQLGTSLATGKHYREAEQAFLLVMDLRPS